MPKVNIESDKPLEEILKVQPGDLILIDGAPFIAANTNSGQLELIQLSDGNRWTIGTFKEKSSESELREYVGKKYKTKLIKSKDYEIYINIK